MNNKGFTARIPDELAPVFDFLATDKKWSFAISIRELVKTSPYYLEYLKKFGGS